MNLRILLLLAAMTAVAGCGDDGDRRPARPEPSTSGNPFPTSDMVPLKTGTTLTTRKFRPALQITPGPGEWMAETGDRPQGLTLALDVEFGQGILAIHRIDKVFDPVRGGEIPGDQVPGPPDLADWISRHPHLEASAPEPVESLGLRGVQLEVTVRSSPPKVPSDCGKFEGDCVPLFHDGFEIVAAPEDSKTRFLVLDDGASGQIVVEEWVEPKRKFARVVHKLDRQLAAIKPAPSGR